MIKKIGIAVAETVSAGIGLVGLFLGGLGVLAIWIALSINTALEDANDS